MINDTPFKYLNMRQIFKTHPWVPPKELPETQELFRKYGVPGSIRPGHLLKGKGEPVKALPHHKRRPLLTMLQIVTKVIRVF